MSRAIITLTTDFGEGSPYVAQMKGAILAVNDQATLVDVTHAVPPQQIRHAALVLADTARCFPPGAIHVAVVDPGVGTDRPIVLAEMGGQCFIAPDNGLLDLAARRARPARIVRVANRRYWRADVSSTFHGRDIMGPAAAHVSLGVPLEEFGPPHPRLAPLDWPDPRVEATRIEGEIVLVDSFGNLISNITTEELAAAPVGARLLVRCAGREIRQLVKAYAHAAQGEPVALVGSSGRLEVAVVGGNAAETLAAEVGDPLSVSW